MIIPVVNMDVTPAVQLMIVISYIALVYGLSVEITVSYTHLTLPTKRIV